MAKTILYLVLLTCLFSCSENETPINPDKGNQIKTGKIETSIDVNGKKREYIVYVPKTYSSNKKYPLLFAFHGLGGNMRSSYDNSKFHLLAESENFIVVHPNGISSKWNAVRAKNNIDIDFTKALINKLQTEYSIDATRIYSSGMSNGGYFSFLLACELSDKIAAIGSVTGLMFKNILDNCQPKRPVPIIQIHGTADNIVDYSGVEKVISYWVNHNNTKKIPIKSNIPNTNTNDGSTVERFIYVTGNNNTQVQHLKITGGGHSWPGYEGNMDINASEEVWNFVKNYDIDGKIK